jgi:hypothetical protein
MEIIIGAVLLVNVIVLLTAGFLSVSSSIDYGDVQ